MPIKPEGKLTDSEGQSGSLKLSFLLLQTFKLDWILSSCTQLLDNVFSTNLAIIKSIPRWA